jgi:hypothetical protein
MFDVQYCALSRVLSAVIVAAGLVTAGIASAEANEAALDHAAHETEPGGYAGHGGHTHNASGHAPIGVMGDHLHRKGEFMFSYRYMYMDMEGNRIGNNRVTPQQIVRTVPNRFDINPMMPGVQPPTLRVVPTRMTMDMHMFGAMYAPTNDLTLMAMINYLEKDMDHLTFNVPGTAVLGGFTTRTEGFGDAKLSGLYRLYDDQVHHWHLNLGLSLPTGNIKKTGEVLTPMGMTATVRLPYAMQLGTGTFDLLPGLTYNGRYQDWTWGAQYRAEIRLEDENNEGYAWGDKHALTGWVSYQWAPWISTSVRFDAMTQESIDGMDVLIAAPVQTAHPENYGGERVDLFFGVNLMGQSGILEGHRLAFEVGAPVYQDLNGPQMETDWQLMVGWQKAF